MTDHVKDHLCQRIEELEKEKLELNEQLDVAQQERDNYQHQFARATEVLGEIHEALNGGGSSIIGMEAVQVRQLQGERDALAAHVEEVNAATQNEMERLVRVNREQQALLDQIYQYVDEQGLAKLGQSRVNALIEAHKRAEVERGAQAMKEDL